MIQMLWIINYRSSKTLAKYLLCTTYCSRVWAYKGDLVSVLESIWREGSWTGGIHSVTGPMTAVCIRCAGIKKEAPNPTDEKGRFTQSF